MLLNPVTQSTQNVAHTEPRYLGAYVGFWGIVSLQFFFSPSTFYLLSHEYIFVFCKKPSVLKLQQHMLAYPPPMYMFAPSILSGIIGIVCGHSQFYVTES